MNKFEDISAVMDGEYGPNPEAVLTAVYGDSELRDAWRRYHLVSDAMRSQLPRQFPAGDLSTRISEALADEPAILSPRRRVRNVARRFMKPVAGIAIAASVALVAIVGLQQSMTARMPAMDSVAGNNAPAVDTGPDVPVQSLQPADPSPLARTVSTEGASVQSGYQQSTNQYRFNTYLINHNEYRANNGVSGSIPHARIVAPYGNN